MAKPNLVKPSTIILKNTSLKKLWNKFQSAKTDGIPALCEILLQVHHRIPCRIVMPSPWAQGLRLETESHRRTLTGLQQETKSHANHGVHGNVRTNRRLYLHSKAPHVFCSHHIGTHRRDGRKWDTAWTTKPCLGPVFKHRNWNVTRMGGERTIGCQVNPGTQPKR